MTGLLRDGQRVVGVRTDRPDGELTAWVVIACDGVNSFLAKEAGLYRSIDPADYTVGVKETLALPKEVIDERFGVRGRDGVDIEILGCTDDVPGGAFIYTNLDTVAIGVVLNVPALAAQERRPEQIIADLKAHPAVAPLVEGRHREQLGGGDDALSPTPVDSYLEHDPTLPRPRRRAIRGNASPGCGFPAPRRRWVVRHTGVRAFLRSQRATGARW